MITEKCHVRKNMKNNHFVGTIVVMYCVGLVIIITSFLFNRDKNIDKFQQRNVTGVALFSMLILVGLESLWYRSNYILAAKKLAVSFRKYSQLDMVLLVVDDFKLITKNNLNELHDVGWIVLFVGGISPPHQGWFVNRYYNSKVFSKLHLWRLTNYKMVLYVDLDMLFVNDPTSLFESSMNKTSCHISMVPDVSQTNYFNAGFLMLSPSSTEYIRLLHFLSTRKANKMLAEQDFLNEYFSGKICAVPKTYNTQISEEHAQGVINDSSYLQHGFFLPSGEAIVLIHYIGNNKPWITEICNTGNLKHLCDYWQQAPFEPLLQRAI